MYNLENFMRNLIALSSVLLVVVTLSSPISPSHAQKKSIVTKSGEVINHLIKKAEQGADKITDYYTPSQVPGSELITKNPVRCLNDACNKVAVILIKKDFIQRVSAFAVFFKKHNGVYSPMATDDGAMIMYINPNGAMRPLLPTAPINRIKTIQEASKLLAGAK